MTHASVILLLISTAAAATGQILLKLGADGRQHLAEFFNGLILAGLIAYGVGTVIWIYVLSSEKLVNVFAFSALTFVLVYIGSAWIDGGRTTPGGLTGIALILAGLYLLTNYNA